MAFAVDPIAISPDGSYFAGISGGTPGYTFSLDGGPFTAVAPTTLNGFTSYYLQGAAGAVAIGTHTIVVRDSATPAAEISQTFERATLVAAPGCINSGPGNAQGTLSISYDTTAYPNAHTETKRVDGVALGRAQTGLEATLVFLENGDLEVKLFDDTTGTPVLVATKAATILCGNSTPLAVVSVTPTLASTATAADATAVAIIQDGQGAGAGFYVETHTGDFVWARAVAGVAPRFTANLTGLAAGQHTLYVRDAYGGTAQFTFVVAVQVVRGCTTPSATNYNALATENDGSCVFAPMVPKPYLSVSLMNTFRFVEMNTNTAPTLDNRLFCGEDWGRVTRPPYYQKVAYGDKLTTQFRSSYAAHVCEIRDFTTNAVVQTMLPVLKVQNIGIQRQYPAWLTPHAGSTQLSNLYFNGGLLPLAFVVGDEINVSNATPATLNTRFVVSQILFDSAQSIPYLVINTPYPQTATPTPRVNVTATTSFDALPYNVYEVTPNTDTLPYGVYYAQIKAVAAAGGFNEVLYRSEPFAFLAAHKRTVLIQYRNYDDAMGLTFTTGLQCNVRVEADFWQRQPGGTRRVYRDPSGRLVKLSSVVQRKIKLQTFKLPPYLHEKIAFAFDMDRFDINGVEFQSEDGYVVPSYNALYGLANSEAIVEQVSAFTDQNGTDLGDVNGIDKGFIITNNRFLKA